MPTQVSRVPKYRRHKASGQAVVTLGGRDYYLGEYGTPESHAEYQRLVGEWLLRGRETPAAVVGTSDLSVNELLVAYLRFAAEYYQQSKELPNIKFALRPLKAIYGHSPASQFGPLSLKNIREEMIRSDLCRKEINKRIGRIVRVFKWGVENELVRPAVYQGLRAVSGLRVGRSAARESDPVKPVPAAYVDALESHVPGPVWAMIQLQRLTGMRPGEVVLMRGSDLDTSGTVWIYRPPIHKTAHRGHQRQIFLGPRAQQVLRPWLTTQLAAFLFSPRDAVAELLRRRAEQRKTPHSYGNRPGTNRRTRPKVIPRECYTVEAYRQAIRRGCLKAKVPHWHPHQLRHNAGTDLRREFGLDVARVILGHRSPVVTEIYAEVDFEKALQVMSKIG